MIRNVCWINLVGFMVVIIAVICTLIFSLDLMMMRNTYAIIVVSYFIAALLMCIGEKRGNK